MDLETLLRLWMAMSPFAVLAITLAVQRGKAARSEIAGLEIRLSRVESEIQHLPDKDVAHRLEMAIARLEGRMETMDERLKPVAAMASRVQEYMLEGTAR